MLQMELMGRMRAGAISFDRHGIEATNNFEIFGASDEHAHALSILIVKCYFSRYAPTLPVAKRIENRWWCHTS